jgi:hypothetical protein
MRPYIVGRLPGLLRRLAAKASTLPLLAKAQFLRSEYQ